MNEVVKDNPFIVTVIPLIMDIHTSMAGTIFRLGFTR